MILKRSFWTLVPPTRLSGLWTRNFSLPHSCSWRVRSKFRITTGLGVVIKIRGRVCSPSSRLTKTEIPWILCRPLRPFEGYWRVRVDFVQWPFRLMSRKRWFPYSPTSLVRNLMWPRILGLKKVLQKVLSKMEMLWPLSAVRSLWANTQSKKFIRPPRVMGVMGVMSMKHLHLNSPPILGMVVIPLVSLRARSLGWLSWHS